MYTEQSAREMAREYREKFGFQLINRLRILSHRYPNVESPNFISWEGEPITGADTTAKVRELLKVCHWD